MGYSSGHFFCVSFYEGDLSWVPALSGGRYHIYAKSDVNEPGIDPRRITRVPNVGYNIYSYLRFIVESYEAMPDVIIFCKNNVFPRHVSRHTFERLVTRTVFTPIEEPGRWRMKYPVAMRSDDNGYLELNNSWYARFFPRKYFCSFDDFFSFIFRDVPAPRYLKFAPGGNYVVPRDHIWLRSRHFYANLLKFCEHHQFACESFMIERALAAIWTSTAEESVAMSTMIPDDALARMSAAVDARRMALGRLWLQRAAGRLRIELIGLIDRVLG